MHNNKNSKNLSAYLEELANYNLDYDYSDRELDPEIEYVSANSKNIKAKTLFICKGNNFKRKYLVEAAKKGAVAYVAEKDYQLDIPFIKVKSVRKAQAALAALFYDHPEQKINLIGVTATKGKSSTVNLIFAILKAKLNAEGLEDPALVSSYRNYNGKEQSKAHMTTPEPLELYKLLSEAVENKAKWAVLEVSSQALKYERVFGLDFTYGAFINIAPDHISDIEHPTFKDYLDSKLLIFKHSKTAVVNLGTDCLEAVLAAAKKDENLITVSRDASNEQADYAILNYDLSLESLSFSFKNMYEGYVFKTKVMGTYYLDNILIAAAIAHDLGIAAKYIQAGLEKFQAKDRSVLLSTLNEDIIIFIDPAHNGLSFEASFSFIEELFPEYKKVAVFGAVGNKAKNRRKTMAQACNKYIDQVILTRDDNAKESLSKINQEVSKYLNPSKLSYESINSRGKAIEYACKQAKDLYKDKRVKTCLLILGKGNDKYMLTKNGREKYLGDTYYVKKSFAKDLKRLY